MELSGTEYKVLIIVIGIIIGLAISFMAYSVMENPMAFIFVPICVVLIYFQMFHPIRRKE
jgi:uncharacterized protein YacL